MTPANHYQLAAFVTFLVNLFLLLFVGRKGRKRLLVIRFMFYSSSIVLWSLSVFLTVTATNYELSYLFNQATHVGAALIPVFFLHFVYEYLEEKRKRFALWISYFTAFFFIVTIVFFRSLFFGQPGISSKLFFTFFPNAGYLYTPWTASFFLIVFLAHIMLLVNALQNDNRNKRNQLLFFFSANLIGYLGGIGCFFPVYNVSYLPFPYGAYGIVLFSIITAYAVVKYRFIDIEVIIRRTLVFAGLLGMVMLTMTVVMALAQGIASHYVSVPPMVVTAITALIAIALFDRTRQILVDLTDRFLFQKKFDYRQLLKDASRGVALIQSLDHLAKLIVAFMTMRARIKSAALFINTDGGDFQLKTARGFVGTTLEKISETHPLIQRLRGKKQPLLRSEFASTDGISDHESREIHSLLSELKAEAVIPSFLGRGSDGTSGRDRLSLRGFLILGAKKSDEEYTQEDLDVFSTLAQESAIAIENARLYDAQIQKTNELAKANEELAFTNKKLNDATSELMKALSETEKAKKELESTQAQMLDMKRRELVARMSAAMGHEIQNPLQGISFTYYHFGKLGKILDEILEYGKEIGDAKIIELTDRTITIVNQDIAQPLRNHTDRIKGIANSVTDLIKGQDRFADIHLGLIINYAIEEIRFTTYWERLSEPTIEINLPRNLPLVHANSHRLQGVFVNLIKNAYDAMKGKVEKHITIRGDDDPENPALIRIYFEDSGCGMDGETARHAFDFKFTTKGDHGTGIGLAYCKDTIEAHGGTVSVKTEPGKGAIFMFTLKKGKPYGVGGDKYEKDVGHRR